MGAKEKVQETTEIMRNSDKDDLREDQQPASAKNIPRPATMLPSAIQGKLQKMTVTFLGDLGTAPNIDEVDRVNKSTDKFRTPIMTVILGLVARAGGKISVEELASQVIKHWNRNLPGNPYKFEEFVYLLTKNSDYFRVE